MSIGQNCLNKKKTRPDVQFKDFSLTKQILDLKWTISELRKSFLKKSIKKQKTENQCQNAASKNKKPLARNVNLILTKN